MVDTKLQLINTDYTMNIAQTSLSLVSAISLLYRHL
jgi:hypothetical protein